MFAALVMEESEKAGWPLRLWRRLYPPSPQASREEALGTLYLCLKAQADHAGRLPWERLAQLAGRMGRRLVLPQGVLPPEQSGLGIFEPDRWNRAVALCTAQAVFDRCGLPLYRRRIGLVDPEGAGGALVEPLLRYCSEVWVCSEALEGYQHLADEMMDRYGASVLLTSSLKLLAHLPLLLAPYPCTLQGLTSDALLLAPSGAEWSGRVVTHLQPAAAALPAPPPGIAPALFAAALYELNGVAALGTLPAATACCRGRCVSLQQLAEYTTQLSREG